MSAEPVNSPSGAPGDGGAGCGSGLCSFQLGRPASPARAPAGPPAVGGFRDPARECHPRPVGGWPELPAPQARPLSHMGAGVSPSPVRGPLCDLRLAPLPRSTERPWKGPCALRTRDLGQGLLPCHPIPPEPQMVQGQDPEQSWGPFTPSGSEYTGTRERPSPGPGTGSPARTQRRPPGRGLGLSTRPTRPRLGGHCPGDSVP